MTRTRVNTDAPVEARLAVIGFYQLEEIGLLIEPPASIPTWTVCTIDLSKLMTGAATPPYTRVTHRDGRSWKLDRALQPDELERLKNLGVVDTTEEIMANPFLNMAFAAAAQKQ